MLYSLALLFLCGMFFSSILQKIRLPGLLGMLLTGILLGPYVGNQLSPEILTISPDLRKLALIIILTRAGLALNLSDLKKVGKPAVCMCFLPATFEIIGVLLLAPPLLGLRLTEAAVVGAVLAAVSPAVVVPKMLKLLDTGYGTAQGIPQMIMAAGSVDDIYVIVLFTAFIGLLQGQSFSPLQVLQVPCSIVLGALFGILLGYLLSIFFAKVHLRDTVKVILLLSISCLLVTLEDALSSKIPFSGLLAIMSMHAMLQQKRPVVAARLSAKFSKLWVGAEILLFVLVGATVNPQYAVKCGFSAVLLILGALLFRMLGVFCSVSTAKLQTKEKLFCMIAYLPKATVQAAIGSIPLSLGLPCGDTVLTVAVLAILISAPLGAFGIDHSYQKLLSQSSNTDT